MQSASVQLGAQGAQNLFIRCFEHAAFVYLCQVAWAAADPGGLHVGRCMTLIWLPACMHESLCQLCPHHQPPCMLERILPDACSGCHMHVMSAWHIRAAQAAANDSMVRSGGWLKREGRVRDHEVLTSRLIDRPLRPLMPKKFRLDTQVLAWCLSFDPTAPPEPLAITAASAAVMLSGDHHTVHHLDYCQPQCIPLVVTRVQRPVGVCSSMSGCCRSCRNVWCISILHEVSPIRLQGCDILQTSPLAGLWLQSGSAWLGTAS